jgi:hypothetical protein
MPGGDGSPKAMEVDDEYSMKMTAALLRLNNNSKAGDDIKERITELEAQLKTHMKTNNKQEMAVTLGYLTGLEYALDLLKGKTNG